MERMARLSQASLVLLGALGLVAALDLGQEILAPLALALVAGVVLSPLSDALEARGVSPVWGALAGIALTLVFAAAMAALFHPVVLRLVEQAPKVWTDMRETVEGLRGLFARVSEVSGEIAAVVA
jgi:predicted PurR-regulated permease PerM